MATAQLARPTWERVQSGLRGGDLSLKIKSRRRCNTVQDCERKSCYGRTFCGSRRKTGVRKSYYPEYMKRGYTQAPFCCIPCVVCIFFNLEWLVIPVFRLSLWVFSSTRCLKSTAVLSINKIKSIAACSFPPNRLSFGSSMASFTVSLTVDRDNPQYQAL